MKVSLAQHELARGIATVGRAVPTAARKALPSTTTILLATDGGQLRLSATDLEIAITLWLPAMIEQEGSTTVPARLFTELVNSLPGERVDLALTDEAHTTAVSCARIKANVRGMDPAEFPLIPTIGDGAALTVPATLLRTMINQVVFAAASDDTRPLFTGVLATASGDTLTLAATDGFRIAERSATLAQPVAAEVSAIIPARTLAELGRILPEGDQPVEVTVTPNRSLALFRSGSLQLIARLIEGQYVAYSRVIPQTHTARAVANLAEFKAALRTARFFARDGKNIVRFSLERCPDQALGTLTVRAAADVGDNVSQIDAAIEGEPQAVAFNVAYIADALGGLASEQVALELCGPAQPGVLRPLDGSAYLCLVMPMCVPR